MASLLPVLLALALVGAGPKGDATAAVDPDTLVVTKPEPPATRTPAEDINRLLRAELSILDAAHSLEIDIARRTGELDRLREQQRIVDKDLARTTDQFDEQTAALDAARQLVRRRLRAMGQLKRTEAYQVLLGSEDYARYLRRARALGALLEADRQRLARYRDQLERWRVAKEDLERRRRNLANTQQAIAHLLQELSWDRQEKEALLDAVRDRGAFQAKVAQEMETVDEALVQQVEELRDDKRGRLWFAENKGKFLIPLRKGTIVGRFGVRTHPKFGTKTVHRGIDIQPDPSEDKVRSIYWGYVAFAGWMRGLGRTVILDHSQGHMSLYAHLGEISVEQGDKVKTGQVLGTVGDSGSLTGQKLYFEIRVDGKAVDPKPWLR